MQVWSRVKSVSLEINFGVYQGKLLPEFRAAFAAQNKVPNMGGWFGLNQAHISVTELLIDCRIIYSHLHSIKDSDTEFTSLFTRLVNRKTLHLETLAVFSEFIDIKLQCQILSHRLQFCLRE